MTSMSNNITHQIVIITTIGGFALSAFLAAAAMGLLSVDEPSMAFIGIFLILFVSSGFVFSTISLFVNIDDKSTGNQAQTAEFVDTFETAGSRESAGQQIQTTDTTEQTETTAMDLRDDGDDAVSDAIEAREAGNLSDAIDYYTEAIELYYTAAEMVDDSEAQAEIEDTIERLQEDRSEIETFHDERQSVAQAVEAGEESLQTAIVAHCQGEKTLSRIRYRQAREQFANAIDLLEADETELLRTPLHISVRGDSSLRSQQLASLPGIDADTVETLEERGISTIDDLQREAGSETEPLAALGLDTDEFDNTDMAGRLTALCWWNDDATQTFRDLETIRRQHDRAVAGFEAT